MLLLTSSDQLALTYWMYGVQGNQISGKTELPDSCRCRRACARTTGKNSWRASGGIPPGGAGVCFGGRAALILRYSRPASSFV